MIESLRRRFKKEFLAVTFLTVFIALVAGAIGVLHSDLFLVRVVEVGELEETAPLEAAQIVALAEIPLDTVNLMTLKLEPIQNKILKNPAIKSVVLSKRFPQSVSIRVEFKKPVGISSDSKGKLFYVDEQGTHFGQVELKKLKDLPLLTADKPEWIPLAAHWLSQVRESPLILNNPSVEIKEVSISKSKGLKVLATYLPKGKLQKSRVQIELGQTFDSKGFAIEKLDSGEMFERVSQVLSYLIDNGISAKQVIADIGKKIVVKIDRS